MKEPRPACAPGSGRQSPFSLTRVLASPRPGLLSWALGTVGHSVAVGQALRRSSGLGLGCLGVGGLWEGITPCSLTPASSEERFGSGNLSQASKLLMVLVILS